MKARLFAKVGPLKGSEFTLRKKATLGRDKDNTVVLPSSSVSKRHARIFHDPRRNRYVLEDLGSLNGTEVDGVRVEGEEVLGHLNVITLAGNLPLLFQDLEVCRMRGEAPLDLPDTDDVRPLTTAVGTLSEGTRIDAEGIALPQFAESAAGAEIPKSADSTHLDLEVPHIPTLPTGATAEPTTPEASADRTHLDLEVPAFPSLPEVEGEPAPVRYVLDVPQLKLRLPLEEGENLVGRSPNVPVRIDLGEVSRRHAVLQVEGEKVTIRDLGSSNQTFVDGKRVVEEVALEPDNALYFGTVAVHLVRDEEA